MAAAVKSLQATFQDVPSFVAMVNKMNSIFTSLPWNFSPEGLEVKRIDTSQPIAILLTMPSSSFSFYDCEEIISLCIEMKNYVKILNYGKLGKIGVPSDSLTFSYSDTEKDLFQLEWTNVKRNVTKTFTLPLKEETEEEETTDFPEYEFSYTVYPPYEELAKQCRDAATLNQSMTIEVNPDEISFSGSDETCSVKTPYPSEKKKVSTPKDKSQQKKAKEKEEEKERITMKIVPLKTKSRLTVTVNPENLLKFLRTPPLENFELSLHLGVETPLLVQFSQTQNSDGPISPGTEAICLKFYVHPRKEQEKETSEPGKEKDSDSDSQTKAKTVSTTKKRKAIDS
jgi:hypothetical protein